MDKKRLSIMARSGTVIIIAILLGGVLGHGTDATRLVMCLRLGIGRVRICGSHDQNDLRVHIDASTSYKYSLVYSIGVNICIE